MRACRIFFDALKEDYAPSFHFTLDERVALKSKLVVLGEFEKSWETEKDSLDKEIKMGNPWLFVFMYICLTISASYGFSAFMHLYDGEKIFACICMSITYMFLIPSIYYNHLKYKRVRLRALYDAIKPVHVE
jgi:hypothetical protein